ncbi:MAG: hypothetical protein ACK6D1_10480 [Planctomycetota bacterium]
MTRPLLDPRVWLPALVGMAAFAPRALPTPEPAPPPRARAVALPTLPPLRRDDKPRSWRLAPDRSTVRFLVEHGAERLLVRCPDATGTWTRDGNGGGALELRYDLASATLLAGTDGLDLHRVLGVRRADTVTFRARLVSTATTDLAGVERLLFLGQLTFGNRVLAQPMQLWACALPGRPVRLQGHGPVRTQEYDLPQRWRLGLPGGAMDVTLGLDLEWQRDAR